MISPISLFLEMRAKLLEAATEYKRAVENHERVTRSTEEARKREQASSLELYEALRQVTERINEEKRN